MRSMSSGALLSRAPSPLVLDGTTGQPWGPGSPIGGRPRAAPASWISLTPVNPTPWICGGGALKDGRLLVDLNPHPDEFGPARKQ